MTKPICHVMVGLPGIGKSTFVEDLKSSGAVFIYSTDNAIEDIAKLSNKTYDEVFKDNINGVQKIINDDLDVAVKNKVDIIWDQTNLGIKKRKKIINRMKHSGYDVYCICFVQPKEQNDKAEWKSRLANRIGKTIPYNVLKNMEKSFILPTKDEGFDRINYYNIRGEEIE